MDNNNDLILKADVLELVQSYGPVTYDMPYGSGDMIIRPEDVMALPAVDAAPVVHGRWIKLAEAPEWDQRRCTVCGDVSCCQRNYCPNCGAKMDEDD